MPPRRTSSRQGIAEMLASKEIRALDAVEPPFDPLEVLSWTHQERPHTRFLAWLLDPDAPRPGGGHAFGAAVLRSLVARALQSVETLPGVDPVALPARADEIAPSSLTVIRELPLGDGVRVTARAPDIRCLWRDGAGHRHVVLIENKVDAGEGEGQVRDYLAWAARHHPDAGRMLIYITPDGRLPESATPGELVASMSWSEAAEAALDAIAQLPHSGEESPSRAFAVSVLDALRMRFGGRGDVRALLEALHDAHPRGAALAASPATEPSLLEPLNKRFPRAAWHLRTLRPRAHRWTRAWADRVAALFREMAPGAPSLRACAPHADRADMASWSIEGVTDCLSLHVFCTSGAAFGSHRARLWVGILAPGSTASAVFEAREQLAAIAALPEATRAWLGSATPVNETPATWRWLCVGAPAVLSRAYSSEDDARRTAKALGELLGAHLGALSKLAEDPSLQLFSCDLDVEHALPTDARDRATLVRDARPDATRVLIATRQPTGHPYELRRACDLGLTFIAAFGGTGELAYDYGPAASGGHVAHPRVVVVAMSLFRAPEDDSLRAVTAVILDAVAAGAMLLLCGDRGDLEVARGALGALVDPLGGEGRFEEFPNGSAEILCDDARFEALATRDARLVTGCSAPTSTSRATVALRVRLAAQGRVGELVPLVGGWRAGAARVVFWAGGAVGPWGRAMQQRPDAFARWWRALVAFGDAL
ncbi:MAG: PD-(D/E)XK nuclease family protein [Polyangiales bacterium]